MHTTERKVSGENRQNNPLFQLKEKECNFHYRSKKTAKETAL